MLRVTARCEVATGPMWSWRYVIKDEYACPVSSPGAPDHPAGALADPTLEPPADDMRDPRSPEDVHRMEVAEGSEVPIPLHLLIEVRPGDDVPSAPASTATAAAAAAAAAAASISIDDAVATEGSATATAATAAATATTDPSASIAPSATVATAAAASTQAHARGKVPWALDKQRQQWVRVLTVGDMIDAKQTKASTGDRWLEAQVLSVSGCATDVSRDYKVHFVGTSTEDDDVISAAQVEKRIQPLFASPGRFKGAAYNWRACLEKGDEVDLRCSGVWKQGLVEAVNEDAALLPPSNPALPVPPGRGPFALCRQKYGGVLSIRRSFGEDIALKVLLSRLTRIEHNLSMT